MKSIVITLAFIGTMAFAAVTFAADNNGGPQGGGPGNSGPADQHSCVEGPPPGPDPC
jgi:hypothetical protein